MQIQPQARPIPKNYTEWRKRLRQRLKSYSAESVIDACIKVLDHWRDRGIDELRSAPWLTLLIVKLVLEDDAISLRGGGACPPQLIDELRDDLWNTPPTRFDDTSAGVFLMVRALIHTQLQLQQPETFAFIRWPALIASLPPDHQLRRQFDAAFGCDPDTFVGVVYAAYAAVLQGRTFIDQGFFEPLRPAYGSAIESFLNCFAKDAPTLRQMLRKELHERIHEVSGGRKVLRADAAQRPENERHEFPWLSQHPLYRHPSGRFAVWHRLVFARGMEEAVHRELSEHGQAYTDPFSRVFESYVVDLARTTGLAFYGEDEIKNGVASRPAVEALIPLRGCNVLIESKMSLFPDQVLISDKGPMVFTKLKRVREGMVQGWRVGELLRSGSVNIEPARVASTDYLIIVTSRQLNLGSGEHFPRLFGDGVVNRINPESSFMGPSPEQLRRLPLRNIFILSIEEFEHLTEAIKGGLVDLLDVLKEAADANSNPRTSSMHFDQILGKYVKRWSHSKLIADARQRAEARLATALDPGQL